MIYEKNFIGLTKELKEKENKIYNLALFNIIMIEFEHMSCFPFEIKEATENGTIIIFKPMTKNNFQETEDKINDFVFTIAKNLNKDLGIPKLKLTKEKENQDENKN